MALSIYSELAERAERKQSLCEKHQAQYFPHGDIQLLIVGESPPIKDSYFYIPESLNRKHRGLPAVIFRALFGAGTKIDKEQCARFLEKFQSHNFLLMDLVTYPLDCLMPDVRAKVLEKESDKFLAKLDSLVLSDSCVKVLILPSGTLKELEKARYILIWNRLEELGFRIIKWSKAEEELQKVAEDLKMRNVL